MKRSVWPQDLVEPQYIEGYFEESQNAYSGLFCFKGKGSDQFKTVFRTLDLVLLSHDDSKKNSHVSLCCFWVKVFRRRFIHCRSCLTISVCGKPVRCKDSLFSEVFFDSIWSSFAQPLVVTFSAGSTGIPCNTDYSLRVFSKIWILLFSISCASFERIASLKSKCTSTHARIITFSSTLTLKW